MYLCSACGKSFTRSDNLRRHEKQSCKQIDNDEPRNKRMKYDVGQQSSCSSSTQTINCCNKTIPTNKINAHRRTLEHRTISCTQKIDGIQIVNSAFKHRIISYRVHSENVYIDYNLFFNDVKYKIIKLLEEIIMVHKSVKVNMETFGNYILPNQEIAEIKAFNSCNRIIDESKDLNEIYKDFVDTMVSQTSEFNEKDSGWGIVEVLYVEVNINKNSPICGSSFIKLPKYIENKKAVVNIKNQDQFCFAWAVTSALFPPTGPVHELVSYPHFSSVLNVTGMDFPVKLKDITKFEIMNDISVNVYGLESEFKDNKMKYEIVGPLRYAPRKLRNHVNLLLITEECTKNHRCNQECVKNHYCWIKNFSRLVSSQISNNEHKKFFCDGCLMYFGSEKLLLQHQNNDCNHVYTMTPSTEFRIDKFGKSVPENILKFENIEKQMKVPFVVYADFESVLQPLDTCEPDPNKSFTIKSFSHRPFSFAYYIKCSFNNSLSKFVLYRGENAATEFIKRIESDLTDIYNKYLKEVVPMLPLSAEEEADFQNASVCGICDKPFGISEVKVKEHNHLTGCYNFCAHSICNLNYKLPNFVPIILHNMSGYDAHFFIKELCANKDKVDVIAQSKEKYISFTKHLYVLSLPI